jgi:DNA (cytosine-5)-methyltransferase 1
VCGDPAGQPELAFKGKDEGLRFIEKTIESINREQGTRYGVELLSLNAADFGVPQIRERVFLVGARDGSRMGALAPTHGPSVNGSKKRQLDLGLALPPYRTAWDAIGDLEDAGDLQDFHVRGKWADLLPSIPEGQNYQYHTERGGGLPLFGWRRRFWNFLLKLAKDQPSWTLTAQPGPATGPFHWKNRRLSARDSSALPRGSIPDIAPCWWARLPSWSRYEFPRPMTQSLSPMLLTCIAWPRNSSFPKPKSST